MTNEGSDTMEEQAKTRLDELRREFEYGQSRLQETELQAAELRQKLLQISGAMSVLEELLAANEGEAAPNGDRPEAAVAG